MACLKEVSEPRLNRFFECEQNLWLHESLCLL